MLHKQSKAHNKAPSARLREWLSYTHPSQFLSLGVMIFYVFSLMGCGDEKCVVGRSCDRICEVGLIPICVASSICECVSSGVGGMESGGATSGDIASGEAGGMTSEPPPMCSPLMLGDLVINEVMIDPNTPEPNNEYVELVNVSDREIDLTGVNLVYNEDEKLRFTQGCMAPRSAVVAYSAATSDEVPWRWSTPPRGIGVYHYRYQFGNEKDFNFSLFAEGGSLLSSFSGPKSMINSGESITRSPELTGEPLEHPLASPNESPESPATCSNLGTFEQGCADGTPGGATGGDTAGDMAGDTAGDLAGSPGGEIAGMIAGDPSGMVGGDGPPPPSCQPPLVNDLIINEVLIDASGADAPGEFIELVNLSDQEVNLDGIGVWYQNSNGELELKISFSPGCMAPLSAVVIRNSTRDIPWEWSSPTSDSASLGSNHSTFQLANSRDAILELRANSGQRLSRMDILESQISEGVSANRSPDAQESNITSHLDLNPNAMTSPGYCPNGQRYEERCGETP